jgi:hypothetical protein
MRAACLVALLCSSTAPAPAPAAMAEQTGAVPAPPGVIIAPCPALDGLIVHGRIRAQGIFGLMSVPGTLSFQNGRLLWTVEGSMDSGPYQLVGSDGACSFSARHAIENGEQVQWSGWSDGWTVTDVTAVWTRTRGDFVHDLLLPEQVTLEFTPDPGRGEPSCRPAGSHGCGEASPGPGGFAFRQPRPKESR